MQCIRVPWLVLVLATLAVGVAFVFLGIDAAPSAQAHTAYDFAAQHIAESYGVPIDALDPYDSGYVRTVAPHVYVVDGNLRLYGIQELYTPFCICLPLFEVL